MKIRELMTTTVRTCGPNDNLNTAANLMWNDDCGCVPVVDDGAHVVGMVTDRDIAMAAYTQGAPIAAIPVTTAMAKSVLTCHGDDDIEVAETLMRDNQIRRVPVVDAQGHLEGLLSLNDIARIANEPRRAGSQFVEGIARTLAGVCRPRRNLRASA